MKDQTDKMNETAEEIAGEAEEAGTEKDGQTSEAIASEKSGESETSVREQAAESRQESGEDGANDSQGGEKAPEQGTRERVETHQPPAERPEGPTREESKDHSVGDRHSAKKPQEKKGPVNLVGVKFRQAGKSYYFNAESLRFNIGEKVIVETDRGLGIARVVTPVFEAGPEEVPPDLRKIIRKANWNDLERDRKNRDREDEAGRLCCQKISERNLDMKLVKVEYLHDASKAIFYFTAEHRVDFRELVKDLARQLHTRIEMRQIGVRDETKLLGGIGPCGRKICCSAFLTDFSPVSVRMAKDQNLAMNPAKVSGLCGRLMCCLAYEHGLYRKLVKTMPKKGKRMISSLGPCRVIDLNILGQKVLVELESGKTVFVPVEELKTLQEAQAEAEAEEEQTLEDIDAPEELWESDDPSALEELEKKSGGEKPGRPGPKTANQERAKEKNDKKSSSEEEQQRAKRKRGRRKRRPGDKPQQGASPERTGTAGQPDKKQPEEGKGPRPPAGTKPHSKRSRKRKRKKKTTT